MSELSNRRQKVTEKYVEILIPYALNNNLIKGLSKLNQFKNIDNVAAIKDEALRRCKACDITFDASHLCQYSVTRISTPHGESSGDIITQRVYDKYLSQYQMQYTVGVYESCLSEAIYQRMVKTYKEEEALKKYQVEAITNSDEFTDIPLLIDRIVTISELDNKAPQKVYSLSSSMLTLKLKKKPHIPPNTEVSVTFSQFWGKKEPISQPYTVLAYENIRQNRQFYTLMRMKIADTCEEQWVEHLKKFIDEHRCSFPAELKYELERSKHIITKDTISLNSPWLLFCVAMRLVI